MIKKIDKWLKEHYKRSWYWIGCLIIFIIMLLFDATLFSTILSTLLLCMFLRYDVVVKK